VLRLGIAGETREARPLITVLQQSRTDRGNVVLGDAEHPGQHAGLALSRARNLSPKGRHGADQGIRTSDLGNISDFLAKPIAMRGQRLTASLDFGWSCDIAGEMIQVREASLLIMPSGADCPMPR
jgi:hypothetical protein